MSIELVLQLLGLVLVVIGGLWAGFWKLSQSMQQQFSKLTDSQTANYHSIDVRLTGIETTVSPYAQHISLLQKQQSENVIKITKLQSMDDKISRLERQVEALQKK